MKILIIVPMPFFIDRETQIRILEEASAFEKLEHQVVIVTYHLGKLVFAESERKVAVQRIGQRLFRKNKINFQIGPKRFLADLFLLWKAYRVGRDFQPDVVYGHLRSGALIGVLVRRFLPGKKRPFIVNFHDWSTAEKPGLLDRRLLNVGDLAITSTEKGASEIRAVRRGQVEIVNDGVNIVRFLGLPTKLSTRTDLELPTDKPIIAYTGSLRSDRGIRYLLEAMPLVLKEHPDAYFLIAGFPIDEALMFVKDHRLEQSARLITPLSYFDLPKLLNASDIGIDPKVSAEPEVSWKALQYMAAGLPIVCFDQSNNRNHIGEGAYYAAGASPQGIADGIIYFLKNRAVAREKGLFNQRKVVEYGWGRSAEKIQKGICDILKFCER